MKRTTLIAIALATLSAGPASAALFKKSMLSSSQRQAITAANKDAAARELNRRSAADATAAKNHQRAKDASATLKALLKDRTLKQWLANTGARIVLHDGPEKGKHYTVVEWVDKYKKFNVDIGGYRYTLRHGESASRTIDTDRLILDKDGVSREISGEYRLHKLAGGYYTQTVPYRRVVSVLTFDRLFGNGRSYLRDEPGFEGVTAESIRQQVDAALAAKGVPKAP
jgi:hypothetical protein